GRRAEALARLRAHTARRFKAAGVDINAGWHVVVAPRSATRKDPPSGPAFLYTPNDSSYPPVTVQQSGGIMRRHTVLALGLATAMAAACSQPAGTLGAAAEALKANDTKSIEYAGTGKWFQFGQAPNPTLPWPQFDVSAYTATVNFAAPSARVQMTRQQPVE